MATNRNNRSWSKVRRQEKPKFNKPTGRTANTKTGFKYKNRKTNNLNRNLVLGKGSKSKIYLKGRDLGKYKSIEERTITVTGTPVEIAQQLLNQPGMERIMNELDMTPSDLLSNIDGAIHAMNNGNQTRFPSCSTGQGFCNGSGLCTGPACFKDCHKYAPGAETGPGFNWGGSGMWGDASVNWNFGAYQGASSGMGTTWTCNVGMSW